jgi:hypothetical protein
VLPSAINSRSAIQYMKAYSDHNESFVLIGTDLGGDPRISDQTGSPHLHYSRLPPIIQERRESSSSFNQTNILKGLSGPRRRSSNFAYQLCTHQITKSIFETEGLPARCFHSYYYDFVQRSIKVKGHSQLLERTLCPILRSKSSSRSYFVVLSFVWAPWAALP